MVARFHEIVGHRGSRRSIVHRLDVARWCARYASPGIGKYALERFIDRARLVKQRRCREQLVLAPTPLRGRASLAAATKKTFATGFLVPRVPLEQAPRTSLDPRDFRIDVSAWDSSLARVHRNTCARACACTFRTFVFRGRLATAGASRFVSAPIVGEAKARTGNVDRDNADSRGYSRHSGALIVRETTEKTFRTAQRYQLRVSQRNVDTWLAARPVTGVAALSIGSRIYQKPLATTVE